MTKSFFAAYPSQPAEIGHAIEAAEAIQSAKLNLKSWKKTFGAGDFIDQSVLPEIKKADGLVFELSMPNNNVFFEAGYAIGLKKPVIPICNTSIKDSAAYLKKLGVFDNVGHERYENGAQLKKHLDVMNIPQPIFVEERELNLKQPIYVLDAFRRSEFAAKVFSAVKESIKFFRSFDPQEEYRMALRTVYDDVSQSSGVLVTLLSSTKEDFELHNLRASFLAGLAIGMDKECLVLSDGPMDTPLDFRDYCKTIKHPDDIQNHINAFGLKALSRLRDDNPQLIAKAHSLINRVSVGSAAAENEFRNLAEYYVDTPQYRAALAAQGRIVIGRKGSGKTAIFWRVRDTIRTKYRTNLVVDLKPDGYQLRKFKEQLVHLLSTGTKEHTLTALWEYLIYGELIHKIFEDDYIKYGRDPELTKKMDNLQPFRQRFGEGREGDFSERMMGLLTQISQRFKEKYGENTKGIFLTTEQVTELLYNVDVREIQNLVLDYLEKKEKTLILVDNIDKGWGAHGVDKDDVLIVRTLIDALRKIERHAIRKKADFSWLLFLRNDVYELLVDDQNDRGKDDKILVDWDSRSALREVVERRVEVSTQHGGVAGVNWLGVAEPKIEGQDSLDWLIDRCLMRPRYLIQLVHQCLGHATASRHTKVQADDFQEGYRLYSLDIIANTNFEIRDVFSPSQDAIYTLIGINRSSTVGQAKKTLHEHGYKDTDIPEIIRLFFWFGIFGAKTQAGDEKFIYDYRYEEKIFSRIRQTTLGDEEPIYINRAFAQGLDCQL